MRESKQYSRRQLFTHFARPPVKQSRLVISNTCDNLYGYCESCVDSCSKQAITWCADQKPVIDTDKCNRCQQCIDACFISAITVADE
ncbi:ferredoxin [Photobacterium aquimaris]|uniref:Ferredoxin n=1 Tax=Photobacterium aquimaris TaxID=512643 RepID=A0A2T3IGK5_9GAMM|nr:4Fe-4S binding protein [Photobacterium aquimaris]OBU21459.1 ferredoxin [Photobacterium aquimaris]PSU26093.1 ferredoxin [Photobacterium aquimaris]